MDTKISFTTFHPKDMFIPFLKIILHTYDCQYFTLEEGKIFPCRYADDYRPFRLAAEDDPESQEKIETICNFYNWVENWKKRAVQSGLKHTLEESSLAKIMERTKEYLTSKGLLEDTTNEKSNFCFSRQQLADLE
jgi:hypothetical protein